MASLVDLVGDNDLEAVDRYLRLTHLQMGKAALLNEITTCEHEGRNAKSAIHRAALRGHAQILERLLQEEVSVDVLDDQGNTPLHLATDLGRARAAQVLLEAGASADIRNCFGRTAQDMSRTNTWDAAETADGKALIRRMISGERMALEGLPPEPSHEASRLAQLACCARNSLADVDAAKDLELVEDAAAEVPVPEPVQETNPEVSYDHLSDFDFATQVDLRSLVRKSDEVGVQRWLQCVALKSVHEVLWPSLPFRTGLAALVGSCEHGDAGEDTRVALSAVHIAALRGNVKILKMLLETGVSPNVTNDQGSTPLHLAVDVDRPEACQLLLKSRADPYLRNNFGRTPYQMRDGRGQLVVPNHTERMVTIVYHAGLHLTDRECNICQEDFREGDVLRVLPCLHKYHAFCVDEWLARSLTRNCPSCLHCVDQTEFADDPPTTFIGGYITV